MKGVLAGYVPIGGLFCGQSHQLAPGDIVRTAHSIWEFVGNDGDRLTWHDRDTDPDGEPRVCISTPPGFFDGMMHSGAWVYAKEGSRTEMRQRAYWSRESSVVASEEQPSNPASDLHLKGDS